jgi:hypothetical protein
MELELPHERQEMWKKSIGIGTVVPTQMIGHYPSSDPQTPENMAATIYHSLGIPATAMWHDALDRPHYIYYGEPIAGLM